MRTRESSARTIAIIIICIMMWVAAFSVDKIRVEKYKSKPWFCYPILNKKDSNTKTYYGIFYKAIVETDTYGNITHVYLTHWFAK